jgi:hypothetical protein
MKNLKKIKIILPIAVVTIIGISILNWIVNINGPKKITPQKNLYTIRINNKIDSIIKMPINNFCPKIYKEIQYEINEFHNQKFLGTSASDNNQWQDILLKNLYSAYASKFTSQAYFTFKKSEWNTDDLKFISSELQMLRSSTYLDKNSPIANSFNLIYEIILKYNEINIFIFNCNHYNYSNYGLNIQFPDMKDKIQKANNYLKNRLDNIYVNNCSSLKVGLKNVPNKLFEKQVNYLIKKINENGPRYNEISSQAEFINLIYSPLSLELESLNNDTYGINENTFQIGKNKLDDLLTNFNNEATDHYN